MDQIPIPKPDYNFKPGMKVLVLEGPFKEFRGKITEVDQTSQKAKVTVNFFGKERQAEFDYSQIAPDHLP